MDGAQNSKRPAIVGAGHMAEGTLATCNEVCKSGDHAPDPANLQRARIFVNDIRQCRTDGEISVPLPKGIIRDQDIAGEIGEVIIGKKEGRRSDDEITLFDSTGVALQDSATVPLEYERSLAAGVGSRRRCFRPESETPQEARLTSADGEAKDRL
jgi:alanine dehydrogenase